MKKVNKLNIKEWILLLCVLFYIILEYIFLSIIPYCYRPYKTNIDIDV